MRLSTQAANWGTIVLKNWLMHIIWFECSTGLFLNHLEHSWWNSIQGEFISFRLGFKLSCSCEELTGTDRIWHENRNCTLWLFSVSMEKEHSPHWKVATLPDKFWNRFGSGLQVEDLSEHYRSFVYILSILFIQNCCAYILFIKNVCLNELSLIITSRLLFR